MPTKKQTAFTLIELLVVIVIIGILAAISTGTFSSYIEKANVVDVQDFDRQVRNALGTSQIANWSFDNTLNDTSGSGNNASKGSPQYTEGVYGNGLDLGDGTTASLLSPSDIEGHEEFTVSFWIKPTAINQGPSGLFWDNVVIGNDGTAWVCCSMGWKEISQKTVREFESRVVQTMLTA